MLDELTIEANEETFVIVLQNGGNDVTCKRSTGAAEILAPRVLRQKVYCSDCPFSP